VAVTGSGGFLGRHVVAELRARGIEPVLVARWAGPEARVPGRVAFDHLHDDTAGLFERMGSPEVLLHLAWGGLPAYGSLHHFEQERPAQYRMLRALAQQGLQHVVVAGTCFEYGQLSGPLHEGMTCQPANPYGHAKHTLHLDLRWLAAQQPLRLTWARLFYLWGEGQAAGSLWPLLQAAALRGDAAFPMSGGEQLRDYLPVAEAARQLVTLALRGGHDSLTVNVCSGRPTSVRSLVEGWIAQHGWPIRPQLGHYPYPAHEPMAFWGDDTVLRQALAATPSPPAGPTHDPV
jgi:nucleoside-diphosphate-sugar epimerase